MTAVSELKGVWRRSMIAWPNGTRDTTTRVCWMQGVRAFVDLRQPRLTADFSQTRGLDDLSMEHCGWLAGQRGFAGRLSFDGAYFEWVRSIDFQPTRLTADAGSLEWE